MFPVGIVASAAAALGLIVFGACGFDPPEKNTAEGGGGGGGKCEAKPGELPSPSCDNSDNDCTEPGCPIDPSCGSTATCMPLSDNTGKSTLDLRIRRLNIVAPSALATAFVQNVVVTKNIDLKSKKCGELGAGAFNWLIQVDKTAGTIRTGGAPPSSDFLGQGYCFYDHTTKTGTLVTPADGKIAFDGDTFSTSAPIPKLNVPIFLGGSTDNVIVLPLTDAQVAKVTVSEGGNCVGKFEPHALDPDCQDDPATCSKWKTAGAIGGFITLEEADAVPVQDLSESLCVLLTGSTKTADNKCPRDGSGKLVPKGDYCSTSLKPGDCQDSFWLAATFAASAVKINDGSTTPECQGGGGPVDAGPDVVDAAGDAASDASDAATD